MKRGNKMKHDEMMKSILTANGYLNAFKAKGLTTEMSIHAMLHILDVYTCDADFNDCEFYEQYKYITDIAITRAQEDNGETYKQHCADTIENNYWNKIREMLQIVPKMEDLIPLRGLLENKKEQDKYKEEGIHSMLYTITTNDEKLIMTIEEEPDGNCILRASMMDINRSVPTKCRIITENNVISEYEATDARTFDKEIFRKWYIRRPILNNIKIELPY